MIESNACAEGTGYTGSRTCQCKDVAPASRPCASRWSVNFGLHAPCSTGDIGIGAGGGWGARSDEGEIRGHCQIQRACSPLPVRSVAILGIQWSAAGLHHQISRATPQPCSASALLAGAGWLLGRNGAIPTTFPCRLFVLRLQ